MKLIKFLLKLKAPRIVYVSCNPATCARDLDYLCHGLVIITSALQTSPRSDLFSQLPELVKLSSQAEHKIKGCYNLKSVQPVDMFPHTPHIECVCLLDLIDCH